MYCRSVSNADKEGGGIKIQKKLVVICGWSLAQHLELDEVVVVLDLDESAVGEVAEAVDAGFAGELHRPAKERLQNF